MEYHVRATTLLLAVVISEQLFAVTGFSYSLFEPGIYLFRHLNRQKKNIINFKTTSF